MIAFQLKIYLKHLTNTWKAFGFGKVMLIRIFIMPFYQLFTAATLLLDRILYPKYQQIDIRKPVFIIGHPRSGTTFLHQLISEDEFVEFKLWEMVFPSLTVRKIIRPLIDRIIKTDKNLLFPAEVGHHMGLDDIEEEELLFSHVLNTQFLTLMSPIGFSDWDFDELVFSDLQPESVRKNTMKFFRGCLQRQALYLHKTQVVSKLNYSGMRLKSLFEAFPDARLIYLVRSPLETQASHFTLHRNMFDHLWGLDQLRDRTAMLNRYYQRRYRHNVAFYRYIEEIFNQAAIPLDQVLVINYKKLRDETESVLNQIFSFIGITPSEKLKQKIQMKLKSQKRYQAKHRNTELKAFGLTEDQVVEDLREIFEKYGFTRN